MKATALEHNLHPCTTQKYWDEMLIVENSIVQIQNPNVGIHLSFLGIF